MATPKSTTQEIQSQNYAAGRQNVVRAERKIQEPHFADTLAEASKSLSVINEAAQPYVEAQGEKLALGSVQDLERGIASLTVDSEFAINDAKEAGPIRPSDEQEARTLAEKKGVAALGEKEFKDLKQAMVNGVITQDQANLMVANQIKKRTQESPMFSRQIRKNAENILGFNATSMQARTLLGALGTEPKTATLTAEQKQFNASTVESSHTGVPVVEIEKKKEHLKAAKRQAESDKIAFDKAGVSLSKAVGSHVAEVSASAQSTLTALVEEAVTENGGTPLNTVAFNNLSETARSGAHNTLSLTFPENATSAEIEAGHKAIDRTYDNLNTVYASSSKETLDAAKLHKLELQRKLVTEEQFNKELILRDVYGPNANLLIETFVKFSDKPELLQTRINNLPNGQAMYDLLTNTEGSKVTEDGVTAIRVLATEALLKKNRGETLTSKEQEAYDFALPLLTMNKNGTAEPDAAEALVDSLFDGPNVVTSSIASSVLFKHAKPNTKAEVKRSYTDDHPVFKNQLSAILAKVSSSDQITYSFDKKGLLKVAIANKPVGHSTVDDAVDRVNIALNSMNRGWSGHLGITKPQLQNEILESLTAGVASATEKQDLVLLNRAIAQEQFGNFGAAERIYNIYRNKVDPTLPEYANVKSGFLNINADFTKYPKTLNSTPTSSAPVVSVPEGRGIFDTATDIADSLNSATISVGNTVDNAIFDTATDIAESLNSATISVGNTVDNAIVEGTTFLAEQASVGVDNLVGTIRDIAPRITETAAEAIDAVANGLATGVPAAKENFKELIEFTSTQSSIGVDNIVAFLKDAGTAAKNAAGSVIDAGAEGLYTVAKQAQAFDEAVVELGEGVDNTIVNAVKSAISLPDSAPVAAPAAKYIPSVKEGVDLPKAMHPQVQAAEEAFEAEGLEFVVTDAMRTPEEAVKRSVENMTTKAASKAAAQKTYASKYDAAIARWHDATNRKEKADAKQDLIDIRSNAGAGGHNTGKAFDVRSKANDSDKVIAKKIKALESLGYTAILENKGGDNQHIHVEM